MQTGRTDFGESGGAHSPRRTLVGEAAALRDVRRQIERVARTDTTVLIVGETGTGKELVASAIHDASLRARGPLVRFDCGAVSSGLVESELFGHERGAFTGALVRRAGRFELAQDGTCFLDEVGELPLDLQPKLLRVLQEHEFERLGGERTIKTNARVVAATNQDLTTMRHAKQFRDDLFYRLNVFPIRVPALRERREDIPLLADTFMRQFARSMEKNLTRIAPGTVSWLVAQPWPGNVRELRNAIERAAVLADGPELEIDPSAELQSRWDDTAESEPVSAELVHVTRAHIESVLRSTNGRISGANGAAARLGMKRSTLNYRLKKLGIPHGTTASRR